MLLNSTEQKVNNIKNITLKLLLHMKCAEVWFGDWFVIFTCRIIVGKKSFIHLLLMSHHGLIFEYVVIFVVFTCNRMTS